MLYPHKEVALGVLQLMLEVGLLRRKRLPLGGVRVVPAAAILEGYFVSSAGWGPLQLVHFVGKWLQFLQLSSDVGHSRQV